MRKEREENTPASKRMERKGDRPEGRGE